MTDHPDCAGNKAIKLFLSEIQDEVPELIKFGRVRRMPRAPVLLVLMVFLAELPPLLQRAPAHSPVTMDTLKADREKRETPEEAKRPWDVFDATTRFGETSAVKRKRSASAQIKASKLVVV